jgi:hypothetical protein
MAFLSGEREPDVLNIVSFFFFEIAFDDFPIEETLLLDDAKDTLSSLSPCFSMSS